MCVIIFILRHMAHPEKPPNPAGWRALAAMLTLHMFVLAVCASIYTADAKSRC